MKRLITFLMAVVCILAAKADDSLLVYEGITPAPGSEITSFDFTLKFDLSKVIETYGVGEYGIGWSGYHNDKRPEKEQSIAIYKGDPSEGIVIGRTFTSGFTGKSNGFVVGPDVNISIEGVIPEPGVVYTMVITNGFRVYAVGSSSMLQNTVLDCMTNPITYTFTGAEASSETLSVTGCSVAANQVMDELTEIKFDFSQPVTVNGDVAVEVTEDGALYAQSTNAELSDDRMSVTYRFDSLPMRLNRSYVISLPGGAVTSVENSSETNATFSIPVSGTYVDYFIIKSSNPASNDKTIFSTIEAIFDMPDGFQIYKKPEYAINLTAALYKGEVSDDNFICNIDGAYNSSRNGIVWTNKTVLEPVTTYILYKPKGEFKAYEVATDKFSNEWYNDEVLITLLTPSIEESGITPIELEAPVIGTYQYNGQNIFLKSGDKISSLNTIEFTIKDLKYNFEGELYSAGIVGSPKVQLFDITDDNTTLIKEVSLLKETRETKVDYYVVYPVNINSNFFEGHRYRLVVPAGSLTAGPNISSLYISNQEYSIEFDGSAPTSVELISCTVTDNDELQEISCVEWKFKGDFVMDSEKKVRVITKVGGIEMPTFVSHNITGETTVQAFYSHNGLPLQLKKGDSVTILLPEGLIYYAGDSSIRNAESRINVIGAVPKPEVVEIEPEYVTLTVETEGVHSAAHKAVKGKTAEVRLTSDAYWKVSGLTLNGEDVADALKNGVYTTPELTADATVKAILAYDGNLVFEDTTGVALLPDSDVRIYSEGGMIVVEGVKAGDEVVVYTVSGMPVGRHTATADKVNITVDGGQYVVRVGNEAAKIQH